MCDLNCVAYEINKKMFNKNSPLKEMQIHLEVTISFVSMNLSYYTVSEYINSRTASLFLDKL